MNAEQYCRIVDIKSELQKLLLLSVTILENNSPIISLKGSGFNLIYEPSVNPDYHYKVREAIYHKIGRISKRLDEQDKTLIIRSVWRSFEHQKLLWDNRVASLQKEYPKLGLKEIHKIASYFIAEESKSMHATGGAVDALIYDKRTDRVMDFGTNDGLNIELNEKCYPYHPDISDEAKQNRRLLIGLFEAEDFICDIKEYWHFDYGNLFWAIEKGEEVAPYGVIRHTW